MAGERHRRLQEEEKSMYVGRKYGAEGVDAGEARKYGGGAGEGGGREAGAGEREGKKEGAALPCPAPALPVLTCALRGRARAPPAPPRPAPGPPPLPPPARHARSPPPPPRPAVMPRCARAGRAGAPPAPGAPGPPGAPGDTDAPLARFYARLPPADRAALLSVDKRAIFERIRANYCSRCFGLFVLRYEVRAGARALGPRRYVRACASLPRARRLTSPPACTQELRNSDALKCPACAEFYAGLVVQDEKESERGKERLSLEKSILAGQPFTTFAESKARERERELQFMAGDICGSGWVKRKGGESMCALHTAPVPLEALLEFWEGLPPEHCTALFRLRDEDFAAEVDAQLRYTLKICRDCRSNVMREYRQLKAGKGAAGGSPNEMEVCKDHFLCISDGLVTLGGKGAAHFFERAEEVEECKVVPSLSPILHAPHMLG